MAHTPTSLPTVNVHIRFLFPIQICRRLYVDTKAYGGVLVRLFREAKAHRTPLEPLASCESSQEATPNTDETVSPSRSGSEQTPANQESRREAVLLIQVIPVIGVVSSGPGLCSRNGRQRRGGGRRRVVSNGERAGRRRGRGCESVTLQFL